MEIVLKVDPGLGTKTEEDILKVIKKMAVIPVAMGNRRADLLSLKQDRGERVRIFASNIQSKSAICAFTMKCGHGVSVVDFTDIISKYVLVNGLEDEEVKRDTLGWAQLDTSTLSEAIAYIEQKEMARDSVKSENSAGIKFSCKKANEDSRLKEKVKCGDCDEKIAKFALNRFGKIGERKFCDACWKNHKRTPKKEDKRKEKKEKEDGEEASSIFLDDAVSITTISSPSHPKRKAVVLDHHIFDDYMGWTKRRSAEQPTLRLKMEVDKADYEALDLPCPKILSGSASGVTDTGVQSCLWSLTDFYRCGFKKSDLLPVKQRLWVANRQPIDIAGAIFLRLSGVGKDGVLRVAPVMVYVSKDTKNFYLSRQALVALGVIPGEARSAMESGEANIWGPDEEEDDNLLAQALLLPDQSSGERGTGRG